MKSKIIIIALAFSIPIFGVGQSLQEFINKTDSFVSTHVKDGKVNYKNINANQGDLDSLLEIAAGIRVDKNQPDNYRAFWINAYNLAVIKGIIDNFPIKSPLDKKGFFDKTTYDLAGKSITLNDIENKMLRAVFDDPRVHFVLVCGANGCPPIIGKAYRPETIETQLDTQTKLALNNPNFIKVKGQKVAVSEIFKWYNEDFVKQDQDVITYLNKYRSTPIASGSKLAYYSYDWNLNAQ